MKTTEELARAIGVDPRRVKRQLKAAQDWRSRLRNYGDSGWTVDKSVQDRRISRKRDMLAIGRIPKWVWLHPDFKDTYFANDQDQETRTKNMELFLRRYPEWRNR